MLHRRRLPLLRVLPLVAELALADFQQLLARPLRRLHQNRIHVADGDKEVKPLATPEGLEAPTAMQHGEGPSRLRVVLRRSLALKHKLSVGRLPILKDSFLYLLLCLQREAHTWRRHGV